ncbi:hypothetical protein L3Q67_38490 [Saccharothrix sp. AJ9571]|nr:hypothetical protein L3Q67_38490 [Saccharothrix sp. AJ9571]
MAALGAAAMLVTGAAAGQAAAEVFAGASDGFEGDPWSRWERFTSGNAVADGDYGGGVARNGANNGWLWAAHGWAAERYGVAIDSWPRNSCKASIWAHPVDGGAQVELQVWDLNGWRLVGTTAPWLGGGSYQRIVTSGINLNGVSKVYVQAIFGNSTGAGKFIRLDDMAFECS